MWNSSTQWCAGGSVEMQNQESTMNTTRPKERERFDSWRSVDQCPGHRCVSRSDLADADARMPGPASAGPWRSIIRARGPALVPLWVWRGELGEQGESGPNSFLDLCRQGRGRKAVRIGDQGRLAPCTPQSAPQFQIPESGQSVFGASESFTSMSRAWGVRVAAPSPTTTFLKRAFSYSPIHPFSQSLGSAAVVHCLQAPPTSPWATMVEPFPPRGRVKDAGGIIMSRQRTIRSASAEGPSTQWARSRQDDSLDSAQARK